MMNKIIIGVDPGLSGCYVAVNPITRKLKYYDIEKIGDKINIGAIAEWLSEFNKKDTMCYMENPHVHRGDGINTCYAAFCYGKSVATCQSIPIILGFKHELIVPVKWKSHFNLTNSKISYEEKKQESTKLAIEMFPEYEHIFLTGKKQGNIIRKIYHHDRAEALLMAIYGINKEGIKLMDYN